MLCVSLWVCLQCADCMSACIQHHGNYSFSLCFAYLFPSQNNCHFFPLSITEVCSVKHTKSVHNWSTLFNVSLSLLFFRIFRNFCVVISSWIELVRLPFECVNLFRSHSVCVLEKILVGVKSQKWNEQNEKHPKEHQWNTHITYVLLLCTNWILATIRKRKKERENRISFDL